MEILISEPGRRSNPYLDRIKLVQGDITHQNTDAIVSLIPKNLEYRGELNDSILRAAGQDLDDFVLEHIYQPRAGDVYAVPGFNLPCKNILFCIVPNWRTDFDRQNRDLLTACRKAVEMAGDMGLSSISIPPLASGKQGFPKTRAARLIVQGITERLNKNLEEIQIVCLADKTMQIFRERLLAIGWQG